MKILLIQDNRIHASQPTFQGAGTLTRTFEKREEAWWEQVLVSPDPQAPDWIKVAPWLNEHLHSVVKTYGTGYDCLKDPVPAAASMQGLAARVTTALGTPSPTETGVSNKPSH